MPTVNARIKNITPDDAKLMANAHAAGFFEEVERITRKFKPEKFGPFVASILYDLIEDQRKWSLMPIHFVVDMIEANCVYYRSGYELDPSEKAVIKIINYLKSYNDPYLKYTLDELNNIELPFMAMAMKQFALQKKPSKDTIARSLLLFSVDNPMPRTSKKFEQAYGLTTYDWIIMCFSVLSLVQDRKPPILKAENFLESEVTTIPKQAVAPFLKLSSLTPSEVKEKHEEIRRDKPLYLHALIRPIFFKYPLITYDDGTYLVVHPGLIVYHASEGLYRVCNELTPEIFPNEFGNSFEVYTKKVLDEIPGVIHIYNEKEIRGKSHGRANDFLVELPDSILLVECKATRYSHDLWTEKAVKNDNSTIKIGEAYDQILATAERLRKGELNDLIDDPNKPLLGICTIYGEIEFVNSAWFFEYVKSNMPNNGKRINDIPLLACMPQTMSIETMEHFVLATREVPISPLELLSKKQSGMYLRDGDWNNYLFNLYDSKIGAKLLPILEQTANEFFNYLVGGNVGFQKTSTQTH